MLRNHFSISLVLWYVIGAAKVYLLGLLLYRKAWREFPWFLVYTALSVLNTGILMWLALSHESLWYSRVYWNLGFVISLVLILVVLEVGTKVFRVACSVFVNHARPVIYITSSVLVFLAIFSAQLPAAQNDITMYSVVDRAVTLLMLSVFGVMALMSNYLGLVWRQRVYGVALGFLFYYFVAVFIDTLISLYGNASPHLTVVRSITALVTQMCWIGYFSLTQKKARITLGQVEQLQRAMQQLSSAC